MVSTPDPPMAATERDRAGVDRADLSGGLGHALVQTATVSYVVLDPMNVAVNARRLADKYDTVLPTSAIQFVLGLGGRQAAAIRVATKGQLIAVASRRH